MATETVALLKLEKNWKLKSRFKFTMRSPPLETQRKYLMNSIMALSRMTELAHQHLQDFPYENSSKDALEQKLTQLKIKFVDIEFPPTDESIFE